MMLAAQMMGVLQDNTGVECLDCGGKCSFKLEGKDQNCKTCNAQGRVYPIGEDWPAKIANLDDLQDTIQMIYQSRERPLLPDEWLDLPASYVTVYRFISPYLFGEFETRKQAMENPDG